jgi:hypothetical protein
MTMSGTVTPPTQAIECAAALLDEAIGRLIKATSTCGPSGRYESDVESMNLLKLIIRHVESVVALANRDLVLLPSAMVVSRSAYEAAIKLLWIATPDDPFQREVRWLAHLQTEEDFYTRMAAQAAKFGGGAAEQQTAEAIRQFRVNVSTMLPEGYVPLKQLPSMYQMLEHLGEERKYPLYIIGCQYAHGTHHATGTYRQNLGTAKVLGEQISARNWYPCFSISWYSLHASGERYLRRVGGDPTAFLSEQFGTRVQEAIDEIGG